MNQTLRHEAERKNQLLQAQEQQNTLSLNQALYGLKSKEQEATAGLNLAKAGYENQQWQAGHGLKEREVTSQEQARLDLARYHDRSAGVAERGATTAEKAQVTTAAHQVRQDANARITANAAASNAAATQQDVTNRGLVYKANAKAQDLQNDAFNDPIAVRPTFTTLMTGLESKYGADYAAKLKTDGLGVWEAVFGDYHLLPAMKDAQGNEMKDEHGEVMRSMSRGRMEGRLKLAEQILQSKYKGVPTAEDMEKRIEKTYEAFLKDPSTRGDASDKKALAEATHRHLDVLNEGIEILQQRKGKLTQDSTRQWSESTNSPWWPGMPTPTPAQMKSDIAPLIEAAYEKELLSFVRRLVAAKGDRSALPPRLEATPTTPPPPAATPAAAGPPAPVTTTGRGLLPGAPRSTTPDVPWWTHVGQTMAANQGRTSRGALPTTPTGDLVGPPVEMPPQGPLAQAVGSIVQQGQASSQEQRLLQGMADGIYQVPIDGVPYRIVIRNGRLVQVLPST